MHIAFISIDSSDKMYPSKKVQIAHLKADEAFTKVFSELAIEHSEYTEINHYAIKLVDD